MNPMDGNLIRFNKTAKFCFIDIETYNLCLNLAFNIPWQISTISYTGDQTPEEHDMLVKWPPREYCTIKKEIALLNHHNQEEIDRKGISPQDAFKIIDEKLQEADYIVGHNILGFDIYLIRGIYRLAGKDWKFIMPKVIDTRSLAQGLKTNHKYDGKSNFLAYEYSMINHRVRGVKTNLKFLAQEYNIPFDESKLHNSLYDLTVNIALWNKLKYEIELSMTPP